MYQHRFDAHADPDPNWHQNYLIPSFTHDVKSELFVYFKSQLDNVFSLSIVSKDLIILSILDGILKSCGKKYRVVYQLFHMPALITIHIGLI